MILLITYEGDPVAAAAETMLLARGVPFFRFEGQHFPARASVTQRFDPRGQVERRMVVDGRTVDLADLTAVWHRRQRVTGSPEIADARMRKLAAIETESLLVQTWSDLAVRFLPAPLAVIRAGQEKLRQLRLATAFGLEIPPTIVTSNPDELLAFFQEHDGHVVTRLVASTSMFESGLGSDFAPVAEPMTTRDIAARHGARLCPVYAQADVAKALELRVTVVGQRVFAAEIHAQPNGHDRRSRAPAAVPYCRHALSRSIADRCVALTQALGLNYGVIDMILRPDGTYVFVEIDPAGDYHWVEQRTGLPITAAIVDFLTQPAVVRRSA